LATYYVEAQHSIADVNAASYAPGDFILFNRGCTWTGTRLNLTQSGELGNLITYGAYGEGPKPVLVYDDATYPTIYCHAPDIHDFKVENLELKNALRGSCLIINTTGAARIYIDAVDVSVCGDKPIFLVGIDTFEVMRCNITAGVNSGITAYGSPVTPICNGIISYNTLNGQGTCTNDGIGIHEDSALNHCGDHFLISHNIIHGYHEQAIDHQCPGNYVVIEDNECYGNGDDGIISRNFHTIIRRNKCYGNGRYGIIIDATEAHPAGDISLFDNDCHDNGRVDILIVGHVDGLKVRGNTGTYQGQEGDPMATENMVEFSLEVTAPPGWFLEIAPATLTVVQGTPAVFTVTTRSEGGYISPITLTVEDLPEGVTATIAPNPISQDGTATVTIPTAAIPKDTKLALQLKGVGA